MELQTFDFVLDVSPNGSYDYKIPSVEILLFLPLEEVLSPLLKIFSFLSLIQFQMVQNISPTLYDAFCTTEQ